MKVKLIYPDIKSDYGATLLRARGIEDVQDFVDPTEKNFQSWKNLANIEEGIKLIEELKDNASIGLVVDQDTDGYTSSAIIYQYLKKLNSSWDIEYYIHEHKQHGVQDILEELKEKSFDLLIVPDASSNEPELITDLDYPVLIIDHHIVEEDVFIAENSVLINNQFSPDYKNKSLSGAGVVYQFCRALDEKYGVNYADDFIDLAALGVCGDAMSGLEIENQYLWKKGFSSINNYFFLTLARKQSYSITGKTAASDEEIIDKLNPMSVAFYIVPLINAMTRVGTMDEKKRMFMAFIDGHKLVESHKRGAKGTLEEVAVESARECTNARTHQNKYLDNAALVIDEKIQKYGLLDNKILFIRLDEDDDFPSELNGLLAMRATNKYKRPVIIARENSYGFLGGSARGLSNSELNSFKDYLSETGLFEYTLGHAQAFGIYLKNSNLSRLHEKANKELSQYNFGENYYEVDFERKGNELDDLEDIIYDLDKYKNVWSTNCAEPLIYINDLRVSKDNIQVIGKNKNTLKITKQGIIFIKFFADKEIQNFLNGENFRLNIVGKTNINYFNGIYTPQIFIEQIEVKEDSIFDF